MPQVRSQLQPAALPSANCLPTVRPSPNRHRCCPSAPPLPPAHTPMLYSLAPLYQEGSLRHLAPGLKHSEWGASVRVGLQGMLSGTVHHVSLPQRRAEQQALDAAPPARRTARVSVFEPGGTCSSCQGIIWLCYARWAWSSFLSFGGSGGKVSSRARERSAPWRRRASGGAPPARRTAEFKGLSIN